MTESQEPQVVHNLGGSKHVLLSSPVIFITFFIVILLGVGAGYLFSQSMHKSAMMQNGSATVAPGIVMGSNDTATFKDTTEGKVEKGGIDGEGQYHLVRPGGPSQNVYMTSSVIDLSQFVGHKVKVWGQTNAGKVAGWLMDVGRVEVEN